jgi:aspartyl-tRNA(Asn)/glutamyl-tRNA(Gln) amidotransferase subunit B
MYYPVIGLEIHTQLKTRSKMFCSCKNNPEEKEPNTNVCSVCLGHPGALPTINKEAVMMTLSAGKALNCKLQDISRFDRKSYFYPDLPKGYQISQEKKPFCYDGFLKIGEKKIRINRIHLEEDTGRLVHDEKNQCSLVDFNRSSIPLMELVTEADIGSAEEARAFAEELRLIFLYLGISDANMENGQMRVEVNISLGKKEGEKGVRVEVKNLNSFRAVFGSIEYEIKRQTEALEKGEKLFQETRGWNEGRGETFSQREKEEAQEYRYLPEPDLPPIFLNEHPFLKNEIKIEIELPSEKRLRFVRDYKIGEKQDLEIFINHQDIANYFEEAVSIAIKNLNIKTEDAMRDVAQIAKNYLLSDVLGMLEGELITTSKITNKSFAEFILLIYKKEISSKIAKIVLKEMFKEGNAPQKIIDSKNLTQMNDSGEIEKVVLEVIKENEKAINDYKNGKEEALKFLIGQVMAKTKGRAAPEELEKMFREAIK